MRLAEAQVVALEPLGVLVQQIAQVGGGACVVVMVSSIDSPLSHPSAQARLSSHSDISGTERSPIIPCRNGGIYKRTRSSKRHQDQAGGSPIKSGSARSRLYSR